MNKATRKAFPDKSVPDSQKKEQYHRDAVLSIMGSTLASRFPHLRSRIIECQHYFNGTQDESVFDYVTTGGVNLHTKDNEGNVVKQTLPAMWRNYQDIRNRVELLVGELEKRGFEIEVRAINAEAKSRKMEFKKRAVMRINMRTHLEMLAQASGIPLGLDDDIPWTMEELEQYMEEGYRQSEERVIQAALEYNIEHLNWRYKRLHQFRDLLIAGMCFSENVIANGYPDIRIYPPENVVWDYDADDDFLHDSQYFGVVEYRTVEEIVQEYGIPSNKIKEYYEEYGKKHGEGFFWTGYIHNKTSTLFRPFTDDGGSFRVLVFKAKWLDITKKKCKVTYDPHGNEHLHILDEEDKNAKLTRKEKEDGGKIEDRQVIIVRKGTMVAGKEMVDWGVDNNMTRSIDNPSITKLNFNALVPNFVNKDVISDVYQLQPLQDLKNMLMYKVEQEIATAGRRGFLFNTKFLPQGYKFEDIIYYSKAFGVIPTFIDPESMIGADRAIEPYDNSISAALASYIAVADQIVQEMDRISGINPARQGFQEGRVGLGVSEMQRAQSNLMTEKKFTLFQQYEQNVWSGQANLIKIVWANNRDRFAPIVGDLGIDILEEDMGVDLCDYGILIHVNPPIMQDRGKFEAMVQASISTGFPVDIALKVLLEKDLKRAVRKFEIEMKKYREMQQQMQMAQLQAQQESAMAKEQARAQGQAQVEDIKGRYSFEEAMMKKEKDKELSAQRSAMDAQKHASKLEVDILKFAEEQRNKPLE